MTPPEWALGGGTPSPHLLGAALHVLKVVGNGQQWAGDALESYWRRVTGAIYTADELGLAQRLLVDVGILADRGGKLSLVSRFRDLPAAHPEDALSILWIETAAHLQEGGAADASAVPEQGQAAAVLPFDEQRRREVLLALHQRFDAQHTKAIGDAGEIIVASHAREELEDLGRIDLARRVRRVSLESDQLGYDVVAPRVDGHDRLLEVKATTLQETDEVRIFLSRGEWAIGARSMDWAMVVVQVNEISGPLGDVVGWCTGEELRDRLPADTSVGRWASAELVLSKTWLKPGIPSCLG